MKPFTDLILEWPHHWFTCTPHHVVILCGNLVSFLRSDNCLCGHSVSLPRSSGNRPGSHSFQSLIYFQQIKENGETWSGSKGAFISRRSEYRPGKERRSPGTDCTEQLQTQRCDRGCWRFHRKFWGPTSYIRSTLWLPVLYCTVTTWFWGTPPSIIWVIHTFPPLIVLLSPSSVVL